MKKKWNVTHYQMRQMELQTKQMPSFPETTELGDPIVKAHWFTGQDLRSMVKRGTWDGPKIGDLSKLKPKEKYGPLVGARHRDPLKGMTNALKAKGPEGCVEYYKQYMEEYKIYLKRKLDNTKMLKDKNINNETTKKIDSADPNVGRIISINEHPKFRPDSSSTEGHGDNLKPEGE